MGTVKLTSSQSWEAPPQCFAVTVECLGGTGPGTSPALGVPTGVFGGQGGGGGAYAKLNSYAVTPGQSYAAVIGAAGQDTYWVSTGTCLAKGANGRIGGSAALCVGDVKYSGGNGGIGTYADYGSTAYGGGGGYSGSPLHNGSNGDDRSYSGEGPDGTDWHGAGGGGGWAADPGGSPTYFNSGGDGGSGSITLTWQITKTFEATSATSISLRRETQALRAAVSSTATSLLRSMAKSPFSTASTPTISWARTTKNMLATTSTTVAALVRRTSRALATTSSATASILRRTGKALVSISYTVIELASGLILYVLTARDWLVHTAGWSKPEMAETVEFWGWLPKALSYPLALSATSAPTAAMQRMTGKVVLAASAVTVTFSRRVRNILWAGASSASATLPKTINKTLFATSYTTSDLLKRRLKLFSLTSGVTASLLRGVGNNLRVTMYVQASIVRRTRNVLSTTSSVIATIANLMHYRVVRQPVVDRAIVVAPVADAYIHAPIAEVTR